MKRILAFIITAVVLCPLVGGCSSKTDMSFAESGTAVFKYGENNTEKKLSKNDLKKLTELFDGKVLYSDDPSCGFTENVAIVFNEKDCFCIANDTCPIIYWKNKDKYFKLLDKEYSELTYILYEYGFTFPCV